MPLNVFKKLQQARCELQKIKIKESGNNSFAKYTYLELGDFIGKANDIFEKVGLCGYVSYAADLATLTIINTDNPAEKIEVTTPMSTADLKGCHPVQSHGAVMTYIRRYLWITALEITEHDELEQTRKPDTKKEEVELDESVLDLINSAATIEDLTAIWKRIDVGLRHGYQQIFTAKKEALKNGAV